MDVARRAGYAIASMHCGGVDLQELDRLCAGDHAEPHRLLGAHPVRDGSNVGSIVRGYHPGATSAECLLSDGAVFPMNRAHPGGVFEVKLPGIPSPFRYRLRFRFSDGHCWETEDPYRFLPTIGEMDLHLLGEGTHRKLWTCLGAHVRQIDGVSGVAFAVWAPNARRVSVIGDFCQWDGRRLPMRQMGCSGVFELFVPGAEAGQHYKFEIKTKEGELRVKSDPLAFAMEPPPTSASRITHSDYSWNDDEWMSERRTWEPAKSPVSIYEVHLGSWARVPEEGNRWLTYREIASKLVAHVRALGFTHVELLPIAEHPLTRSWGYQVTGFFAPTWRYGTPDDFRFLIDCCHQHGIGVILDWVPAHFPRDDHALRRFDGTALYEHEDPRQGEHPDWGTLVYNYERREVRSFLLSNALYWLEEFHVDALRVDAVASMLYLDYSRKPGEWIPNAYGGKENIGAIELLRSVNEAVRIDHSGCFTVAEESTAWAGVTRPVSEGGLGFTFKWNMGWMHDTLSFFSKDPVHRRFHLDELTFAMLYEHTERFIMPLSHDEVVHGKRSLLEKMPGDLWQKFANLRLLLTYQYTRPGKKLLFMGTELAPHEEWNHDASLDWHLADEDRRRGLRWFLECLGRLYLDSPCLWRSDPMPDGFSWIDCHDRENTVLSFWRTSGDDALLILLNFTPVPRDNYRVGAPKPGSYRRILTSDDRSFGGSEFETPVIAIAEDIPFHGRPRSLSLRLPPLGALILKPVE